MDIRIFQIDMDRDEHRVAFESLEATKKYSGREDIDSSIYEQVYAGSVDCKDLEDVYTKFNLNSPPEFRGHSLSKSDVVEVMSSSEDLGETKPGCYFCDTIGFQEIQFDPALTSKREDLLKVVLMEPGTEARIVEIGPDLYDAQRAVRGQIEVIEPFDDKVCLVCNEEGIIYDLPPNRVFHDAVFAEDTVILGNCFICGVQGENFVSLTDQQAERYLEMFRTPPEFEQKWNGTWEVKTSLDQKIASAEAMKNEPAGREDNRPVRDGR